MFIFAAVVLGAAVIMLRSPALTAAPAGPRSRAVLPLAGAGVGALTGLVGVGGGFLTVPVLSGPGRLALPAAIGTSALIIALNSLAGLLGFLGEFSLLRREILWFAAPAAIGTLAGAQLIPRVPEVVLRRGFVLLLVVVEVVVIHGIFFGS